MTETTPAVTVLEQVAAVLADHADVSIVRQPGRNGISVNDRVCQCGHVLPWDLEQMRPAHQAHVAETLAAAGLLAPDGETTQEWTVRTIRADGHVHYAHRDGTRRANAEERAATLRELQADGGTFNGQRIVTVEVVHRERTRIPDQLTDWAPAHDSA